MNTDSTNQSDKEDGNYVQTEREVLHSSFAHHLSQNGVINKFLLFFNESIRVPKSSDC